MWIFIMFWPYQLEEIFDNDAQTIEKKICNLKYICSKIHIQCRPSIEFFAIQYF